MNRSSTIIQLTDTHLRGDDALAHGQVDTSQHLEDVLDAVRSAGNPVDAIVVSGDASDDGSAASYAALRSLVDPVAAALDAPVIHAPGNHDDVDGYAAAVGAEGGFDRRYDIGDLRIITLDSTRIPRHDGWLDDDQLCWLDLTLQSPPRLGTIVCAHHPAIGSPVRTVDALRLKNGAAFAEILVRHSVRLVLSGHTHYTGCGTFAGAPVWLGTPSSYSLNAWSPAGEQTAVDRYGFSRIDIDEHSVSAIAVPVGHLRTVYRRRTREYDDKLKPYL